MDCHLHLRLRTTCFPSRVRVVNEAFRARSNLFHPHTMSLHPKHEVAFATRKPGFTAKASTATSQLPSSCRVEIPLWEQQVQAVQRLKNHPINAIVTKDCLCSRLMWSEDDCTCMHSLLWSETPETRRTQVDLQQLSQLLSELFFLQNNGEIRVVQTPVSLSRAFM